MAGCDLNPEKLAACRDELPGLYYTDSFERMLERSDVEIVAIYTPDSAHAEHVERAFAAGKDVICTKPLANSLADARRILDAGARTGRRLLVGQSTRFFEPFRRQRRDFRPGRFGNVELADARSTSIAWTGTTTRAPGPPPIRTGSSLASATRSTCSAGIWARSIPCRRWLRGAGLLAGSGA